MEKTKASVKSPVSEELFGLSLNEKSQKLLDNVVSDKKVNEI